MFKDDEVIRQSLLEIEEIVRGKPFEEWRKSFVQSHIHTFSFENEDKLIYTEIHKDYESQVEQKIEDGLPKDFDMKGFMTSLPHYMEV